MGGSLSDAIHVSHKVRPGKKRWRVSQQQPLNEYWSRSGRHDIEGSVRSSSSETPLGLSYPPRHESRGFLIPSTTPNQTSSISKQARYHGCCHCLSVHLIAVQADVSQAAVAHQGLRHGDNPVISDRVILNRCIHATSRVLRLDNVSTKQNKKN